MSRQLQGDLLQSESSTRILLRLQAVESDNDLKGYIALHQPDASYPESLRTMSSRNIDTGKIDWSAIRRWLQICDKDHVCNSELKGKNWLSGFKLIDVKSREIVPAPDGGQYAALSYVWGNAAQEDLGDGLFLPQPAPKTIEDAITCTQALGIDFLWIDRYCIDQNAVETKHTMIQNMDKIYADATLTIINATGSCPSSGMAGVSGTIREAPKCVNIYGERLSVVPNVAHTIGSSHWNSRAWTYQEGLLSNRRLIFTTSQVYFQCLDMHCCESLAAEFSTAQAHGNSLPKMLSFFPQLGGIHRVPQDLRTRSREYLHRTLTYDSDILNAFSGILHRFWHAPEPTYHFWGLECTRDDLLGALLWTPVCDDPFQKVSRRASFPSWSWAGWRNLNVFHGADENCLADCIEVSVTIEDISGKRYDIKSYIASMSVNWDIYRFKPTIHLTSWVAHVYLRPQSATHNEHATTVDVMSTACDIRLTSAEVLQPYLSEPSVADEQDNSRSTWLLLFWISRVNKIHRRYGPKLFCSGLVLKHVGGQRYERAGVIDSQLSTNMDWRVEPNPLTAQIRDEYWPPGVWLECHYQSIELV